MSFYSFIILISSLIIIGCNQPETQTKTNSVTKNDTITEDAEIVKVRAPNEKEFSRSDSFTKLKRKISNGDSIFIHMLVPLCDNASQGIIPVPEHLGDGLDPASNLYWGAMYGIKSYFKRSKWELIETKENVDSTILQRIILKRELPSSSVAILVADAYRGDRMYQCLHDFINGLAGNKKKIIETDDQKIMLNSLADLTLFNGHNGLMDYEYPLIPSSDTIIRETAVIGCRSYEYFRPHLLASYGYPILTTSNLMAPEAYVAEGLIDSWLLLKTEDEIRTAVGKAYNSFQNCGIRGATNLFYAGWR